MTLDAAQCIAWTLKWEGSQFTDHAHDRGGPTKYGITLRTLQGLGSLGDMDGDGDVDRTDVQRLDHATAIRVYRELYWVGTADAAHARDWRIGLVLFDAGVHSGSGWSRRRLQEVLGVTRDGVLGPQTLRALDREVLTGAGAAAVCRALLAHRTALLASLLERDPRQLTFARGWANRIADLCRTIGVTWPDGPTRAHFDRGAAAAPPLAA